MDAPAAYTVGSHSAEPVAADQALGDLVRVIETSIPVVKIVEPTRHGDDRGFLSETYNQRVFSECGIAVPFIQDNHVYTELAGTIRGLHYQAAPRAQAKIVRVLRGAILDVAVDLRRDASTFGQHVTAELSAENWQQMVIPEGFAHAFCSLEAETEVLYKVSDFWAPDHERGVLWTRSGARDRLAGRRSGSAPQRARLAVPAAG